MSARRPMVLVLIAVGLAALAAYPTVGTGYGVRAMLQLFMWIALAGSWNLVSGLTGYVSFGHVAFFGIGSYATAILITRAAWPPACWRCSSDGRVCASKVRTSRSPCSG